MDKAREVTRSDNVMRAVLLVAQQFGALAVRARADGRVLHVMLDLGIANISMPQAIKRELCKHISTTEVERFKVTRSWPPRKKGGG